MSLSIEIQKKPKGIENKKVRGTRDVFELDEIQEIKDAVQEHMLFIGLDCANNIKNISLLGIGTSKGIDIDSKYIIRTALITSSDKVILVHNHPSNTLKPSREDIYMTNVVNKVLEMFNIRLMDHIIVTENEFVSMMNENVINKNYENDNLNFLDNTFLKEENHKLKGQVEKLKDKLQEYRQIEEEDEEEFE